MGELRKKTNFKIRSAYFFVIGIAVAVVILVVKTIFDLISGTNLIDVFENLLLIIFFGSYVCFYLPDDRAAYKKLKKK